MPVRGARSVAVPAAALLAVTLLGGCAGDDRRPPRIPRSWRPGIPRPRPIYRTPASRPPQAHRRRRPTGEYNAECPATANARPFAKTRFALHAGLALEPSTATSTGRCGAAASSARGAETEAKLPEGGRGRCLHPSRAEGRQALRHGQPDVVQGDQGGQRQLRQPARQTEERHRHTGRPRRRHESPSSPCGRTPRGTATTSRRGTSPSPARAERGLRPGDERPTYAWPTRWGHQAWSGRSRAGCTAPADRSTPGA